MPLYCLFIEYLLTGHTTVLTFSRAEERGYHIVLLARQPVRMRCVDYEAAASRDIIQGWRLLGLAYYTMQQGVRLADRGSL